MHVITPLSVLACLLVQPQVNRQASATPTAALSEFRVDLALAHVQHLAGVIGPRIAGTAGESRAADYIEQQLIDGGYAVIRPRDIALTPVKHRFSQNVIARKPTDGSGHKYKIVVGAHYDSIFKRGGSPGANDNASGVAVMLEVARVLATADLPYALEFVAFGAEESVDGYPLHHHYGSRHYVAAYGRDRRSSPQSIPIIGMISIDMVGVGADFHARTLGVADPYLCHKALTVAKATNMPMRKLVGKPWSDHEAFEKAGIPSVWLQRRPDPAWHTSRDVSANVRREHLSTAGGLTIRLLCSLSTSDVEELATRSKKGRNAM